MATIKATALNVGSDAIQFPTHVSLVDGIASSITSAINAAAPKAASATAAGLMSAADFSKLAGIAADAQNFYAQRSTTKTKYMSDQKYTASDGNEYLYGDFNLLVDPGFHHVDMSSRKWINCPYQHRQSTTYVLVLGSRADASTALTFQIVLPFAEGNNEFNIYVRSIWPTRPSGPMYGHWYKIDAEQSTTYTGA